MLDGADDSNTIQYFFFKEEHFQKIRPSTQIPPYYGDFCKNISRFFRNEQGDFMTRQEVEALIKNMENK